ncbi:MAG: phosphate/phosphite/phosphonate ABC transporter substrate-binding protein [Planctomycetes bacterium]|nr:phosphate/phosphite/phosphonate ABC transporter substrate-binding protein [Planctomycetota bacterium]
MTRFIWLLAVALMFTTTACTSDNSSSDSNDNKLVFTAIADDNAKDLKENYDKVAKYLSAKTGKQVEFIFVNNYSAAVTSLANGHADFAWLGGVTTVQAIKACKGEAEVLCCRGIDKKFKTYFVANKDSGVGKVTGLKALAELAKKKTFTFGSISSTSGHLMPRHFFGLQTEGAKPEDVFGKVAYSGSHDATLKQVADGTYDIGALNFATWDKASDELKANAPVIYVTPEFVDYSWVIRQDVGAETISKLRAVFLEMGESDEGRELLKFFSAEKFIKAEISEWDGIKAIMESGVNIGS